MKTIRILKQRVYSTLQDQDIEDMMPFIFRNGEYEDKVTEIYVYDIGMGLTTSYGRYNMSVTLRINEEKVTLTHNTSNTDLYDAMKSCEYGSEEYNDVIKQIFDAVLEEEGNQQILRNMFDNINEQE